MHQRSEPPWDLWARIKTVIFIVSLSVCPFITLLCCAVKLDISSRGFEFDEV